MDLREHRHVHFVILSHSKGVLGRSILCACEQLSTFRLCVPSISDGHLLATIEGRMSLIKPFKHPNLLKKTGKMKHWPTTVVIGHRGIGANSPSLNENSLLSLHAASIHGAKYVEFDVQLTRDLCPVLHHDWTVKEAGVPIFISQLSKNDFMDLCKKPENGNAPHEWHGDIKQLKRIRSQFATLDEALMTLPPELGFNVEIKYPMPIELFVSATYRPT